MKLSVTKRQNPNTPYIDGFEADILLDDGTLAGRRAFTLVRIQDMLNDEAGLLENFEDCSDYAYAKEVLGEDFLAGRNSDLTPLGQILEKNGCFNILVLKCLEILPEYRGRGCGKEADRMVWELMAGQYGLVIKKASPLQYEDFSLNYDPAWAKKMGYLCMQGDKQKDTEALVSKYESWGYTRIEGTTFLYKDPLDT